MFYRKPCAFLDFFSKWDSILKGKSADLVEAIQMDLMGAVQNGEWCSTLRFRINGGWGGFVLIINRRSEDLVKYKKQGRGDWGVVINGGAFCLYWSR